MKSLLLFAACLAVAAAAPAGWHMRSHRAAFLRRIELAYEARGEQLPPAPPAHWQTQPVSHFDVETTATYQQRYYVNDTFWKGDGPVFILIDGEGAASPYDAVFGEHMELAAKYNALVFALEHRYYGASVPTSTLSTENLQWLSSQEALADLASFHAARTAEYKLAEGTRWICYGGSYPGALSAWARIKYPHLFYGSIASSAPVEAVVNFEGYNEVVDASISAPVVGGSSSCASNTRAAFQTVDSMLDTTSGRKKLRDMFYSCGSLEEVNDRTQFAGNLAGNFQGTVQYNDELPGRLNISVICSIMTNASNTPLTNLAAVNRAFMTQDQVTCVDNSWAAMMAQLGNTTVDKSAHGVGDRQWIWQTCSQFGFYQTCDSNTTCPFSPLLTLASNTVICNQLFGIDTAAIYKRIAFELAYYGGNKPAGTRIVFVNGSIDPWHYLSVLKAIAPSESAVFIDGTAHCANMMPSRSNDPQPLVQARLQISKQVGEWLSASE